MSTAFTTPYNYDPNVTRAAITGEAHVVPSVAPYEIHLLHIPRQESPSSVAITGYTEAASTPAQGQFQVIYTDGTGNPADRVTFNSADAGKSVSVSYHACGTLVYAQEIVTGDNRPNLKQLQDSINARENAEGSAGGIATLDASGNLVQPISNAAQIPSIGSGKTWTVHASMHGTAAAAGDYLGGGGWTNPVRPAAVVSTTVGSPDASSNIAAGASGVRAFTSSVSGGSLQAQAAAAGEAYWSGTVTLAS